MSSDTQALLTQLALHPSYPVVFILGNSGLSIPAGYHLTELKVQQISSIDCGGDVQSWRENSLQLWSPPVKSASAPLSAQKFLDIYQIALKHLAIDSSDTVRFEYGAPDQAAISWSVEDIQMQDTQLEIYLQAIQVQCKALSRLEAHLAELSAQGLETTELSACGCTVGSSC